MLTLILLTTLTRFIITLLEVLFETYNKLIICLKFNLYQNAENMNRSYDLIVGSCKGEEGILRIYEGRESDGDFRNVTPVSYDGFARIADVCFKERIY